MTVIQYCREEAKWRDLVIIRVGGWVSCSAISTTRIYYACRLI